MNDYLKNMQDYSPIEDATDKTMKEVTVVETKDVPQTTALIDEKQSETAPYMMPKTIEVRRYTLKK